ncbi:hypothetical protein ASG43_09400 [Aureimonas sp. Leaf454]|uniref:hypothetical protein n=1 Tax=Aureimonas sp. Leaf454 TaxID=1736381 RepID=UPI0006FA10B0|nr:hypothetical protein [Aureimonas sp. Leaf454]KQT47337.1 hypothetical protein ASG43_09400 [Aureimonas sp. Leaf454]
MHPRDTARQRAEALFKPSAPHAARAEAPSPFDSIKRQAALAHSIGRLKRSDRPVGTIALPAVADGTRES